MLCEKSPNKFVTQTIVTTDDFRILHERYCFNVKVYPSYPCQILNDSYVQKMGSNMTWWDVTGTKIFSFCISYLTADRSQSPEHTINVLKKVVLNWAMLKMSHSMLNY